jgi:hypothetical protein
MQARLPEDLIGVEIADPGDEVLTQQQRLDPEAAPADALAELCQGERGVEWFDP